MGHPRTTRWDFRKRLLPEPRMQRRYAKYESPLLPLIVQGFDTQKSPRPAELFFNSQQLVVFCDAVGARGGAGFNLPRSRRDGEIGNKSIFTLARPVRDYGRIAIAPGEIDCIKRLADRSNLIDLDED